MSLIGWFTGSGPRSEAAKVEEKLEPQTAKPRKGGMINREAAADRMRKNSPWRFDDGPYRRGRAEERD